MYWAIPCQKAVVHPLDLRPWDMHTFRLHAAVAYAKGGGAEEPAPFFAGHSGEMSHSPAPYTSRPNQTPFGGIEKPAPAHH